MKSIDYAHYLFPPAHFLFPKTEKKTFRRIFYNFFYHDRRELRRKRKYGKNEAFSRCKINTQIIANAQSTWCAYGNHLEEFSSRDLCLRSFVFCCFTLACTLISCECKAASVDQKWILGSNVNKRQTLIDEEGLEMYLIFLEIQADCRFFKKKKNQAFMKKIKEKFKMPWIFFWLYDNIKFSKK